MQFDFPQAMAVTAVPHALPVLELPRYFYMFGYQLGPRFD
jgi:hypothetical protein